MKKKTGNFQSSSDNVGRKKTRSFHSFSENVKRKKGIITEVESNGILLSRENVARLKKAGLHHIIIRIEGSKAQTHDAISNYEGCFE